MYYFAVMYQKEIPVILVVQFLKWSKLHRKHVNRVIYLYDKKSTTIDVCVCIYIYNKTIHRSNMGLCTSVSSLLPYYHQGSNQKDFFFFVPWFLTHEKQSAFCSRSKRAESDARGQINYPRQPFPLSSPSDTPEKSGPYQRQKGPSASQVSYFPPFYFTVTFHCSFSFPQLLSLYPISLYPFHPSFLYSLDL